MEPLVLVRHPELGANPPQSNRVVVDLTALATINAGLTIRCELDDKTCRNRIVVSEEQMQSLNIKRAEFRGEWNSTIAPSLQNIERLIPDGP